MTHGLWSRLVTGDGLRKTRLHTYSGNLIDLAGLRYLPHSVWSVLLLKAFGYRQRVSWLGYRAVKRLRSLIRPDWTILEFGSGMSSLLFAQLCKQLVSVESDPSWFEQVQLLLAESELPDVDYRLRSAEQYTLHPDLPDGAFDLGVVDGIVRDEAAVVAVQKVKPGGYVFFDNSDVPWPEYKAARRVLLEAAAADGIWFFNDLCPFQIQVNESMLIRVKSRA